jgi:uncharacterized damage-inducible protein DinB
MNKYHLLCLFLLISLFTGIAQQATPKDAFLEKWANSKNYLLAIAEAMPEEHYDFKPTARQMSFEKQLLHIQRNMEWLSTTYFGKEESEIISGEKSKDQVIKSLISSFNATKVAVANASDADFKVTVEFFAGEKSKLQILNLLQDHVTHHRGQLIVYLNLNDIKPPSYVGW